MQSIHFIFKRYENERSESECLFFLPIILNSLKYFNELTKCDHATWWSTLNVSHDNFSIVVYCRRNRLLNVTTYGTGTGFGRLERHFAQPICASHRHCYLKKEKHAWGWTILGSCFARYMSAVEFTKNVGLHDNPQFEKSSIM